MAGMRPGPGGGGRAGLADLLARVGRPRAPAGLTGGRWEPALSPVLSQGGATAVIMLVGDTYTLINYVSFINYLCYGVTILGLLVLRWRWPALHRPIKVRPGGDQPAHVPEAVRATPLPVWAPGAAMAAMVRPAFAVCWALLRALCALAYPVLKAAPWGRCYEYSHFTDRKIRLRHYGHTGFHKPTENRRPKTELKEKSSRLHINL